MTVLYTLSERPDGILVALVGEVDLMVAGDLRDILDLTVTRGTGEIEIGLRAVTFLDCAAIGVIVAGWHAARRAGRVLFISHPTGIVRKVLELTGDLDHLTAGCPPLACQPHAARRMRIRQRTVAPHPALPSQPS